MDENQKIENSFGEGLSNLARGVDPKRSIDTSWQEGQISSLEHDSGILHKAIIRHKTLSADSTITKAKNNTEVGPIISNWAKELSVPDAATVQELYAAMEGRKIFLEGIVKRIQEFEK